MIKSLVVKGLWGRYDYDLQFNEDVNIFTGSNGTGKTTLLKMLWYAYSGNYERLIGEIFFQELTVDFTNNFKVIIKTKGERSNRKPYHFELFEGSGRKFVEETGVFIGSRLIPDNNGHSSIYFLGDEDMIPGSSSNFFPTFRRLEGGFSLDENSELNNVLIEFTNRLSTRGHRFIASSNSSDIRAIINEISSDIRVRIDSINNRFVNFITKEANRSFPAFETDLKNALEQKSKAEEKLKEPIDNLSKYVDRFFWEKSIKISENLRLGQHEIEIDIENLSAGEKNLLSFLVYATYLKEGVMFIDEPELNLHIEWQRELVATLRDIAPNVQLFMASHSPAIYAGYDDKSPWFNDLIRHTTSNEPALVE